MGCYEFTALNENDKTAEGLISVKKLCYALRARAAVDWVIGKETMPPTAFASVLDGLSLAADEAKAIDELLTKKSQAAEEDCVLPDKRLDGLLTDRYDELNKTRWRKKMPATEETRSALEVIFRKYVKGT